MFENLSMLKRRQFLSIGSGAAAAAFVVPVGALGQQQVRVRRVRLSSARTVSARRNYSYRLIPDPTGTAGSDRVARFELRGGDCSSRGDCTPRASGRGYEVARTRTERVIETSMQDGDEGYFRYRMYLPTSEYAFVDSVNTTLGQLLAGFRRGREYDSFPIFAIDTGLDNPGGRMSAQLATAREEKLGAQSQLPLDFGNFNRDSYLRDRWVDISVRFGLSSGTDGYVEASVNGTQLGKIEGKTIQSDGFAEIRYGIYQTGTNFFPTGPSNIPTQVAYFTGVDLLQVV